MRVAIVGSGISGLVSAWVLQREHEITLFEASDRIGGHSRTVDVTRSDGSIDTIDTGFVVYNEATYPRFVRFLDRLGVETQPTTMSFSVRCDTSGLEYAGTSLNTLFAQRRNLLRPPFYRMLREILRFNRIAAALQAEPPAGPSPLLRDFLVAHRFRPDFRSYYLLPMAAAIWSSTPQQILDFPVDFLFRFLSNHRLLAATGQHPWRTVRGGSREYVRRATSSFSNRIRTNTPVERVRRRPEGVEIHTKLGTEHFDRVVLATHSDQALRLLEAPREREAAILGAMRYQDNEAALHRDASLLPTNRRARASWNFTVERESRPRPSVTYDMTRLHGLRRKDPICVSLNQNERVAPESVLETTTFEHPVFTPASVAAQRRHAEIDGLDRIHYCGAYWGNGFHEDGVASALAVCSKFGLAL